MQRKILIIISATLLAVGLLAGCGATTGADQTAEITDKDVIEQSASEDSQNIDCPLEDGLYVAEFTTDASMFHVNEAYGNKGILTVENGHMTMHVSLVSKNIVNLYLGAAEDAKKDGAELLEPTTDNVTYSDGWKEEVYGFDIPVPVLDEEFDLALIGTKGTWYDHKVVVGNAVPATDDDIEKLGRK